MNVVIDLMSKESKEIRINVRTTEDIKRDFEIAAKLRGLTVSSMVNSMAVKIIREEKEREPEAFVKGQTKIKAKATVAGGISPKRPENGELNFTGAKTRKSKTKEQALQDELDEVVVTRKNKK